jgi:oligopeptide transport system substrate-binding protein
MKLQHFSVIILSSLLLAGCKQATPNRNAWLSDPKGHIRFAMDNDPQTLDPRYARDINTINVVKNLYEGLLRKQDDGTYSPAMAESFHVSEDDLTYTFKLRQATWSNGDAVTSSHFADSWKGQLLPEATAPNANQLYVIKNARAVKEGRVSVEQLGIETPDASTLIIHLESPVPYFQGLLASHFFLPIHPQSTAEAPITNGPFMLESWKKNNELVGIKSPTYWDVGQVNLSKFSFIHLENHTALQMYEADQLEWAGSPISTIPQDALMSLKRKQHLFSTPSAGTFWFRVNTTKSPLNNVKLRKALAYAVDRSALVKNVIQGNNRPALAVVPPGMGLEDKDYFSDDVTEAWALFQESLKDLNLTLESFPKITILYNTSAERNQRVVQAIQQQWKKVFGDYFVLKGLETKSYFQQITALDYDIALGSWFADIDDPSNFLDLFSLKTNGGNNTGWENAKYTEAMALSLTQTSTDERRKTLEAAQEILLDEMPVIPLFYGVFNYVKKRDVSGVNLSELGILDLKYSYIDIGDVEELEVME